MTVDLKAHSKFFKKQNITHSVDRVLNALNRAVSPHAGADGQATMGRNDSIIQLVTHDAGFTDRMEDMMAEKNQMEELLAIIRAAGREDVIHLSDIKDMWIVGCRSYLDDTVAYIRLLEEPNLEYLLARIREELNELDMFGPKSTIFFCNWGDIVKTVAH